MIKPGRAIILRGQYLRKIESLELRRCRCFSTTLRYVTLVTLAGTAIRIHGISWYLTEIRLQFGFNETAKRPNIAYYSISRSQSLSYPTLRVVCTSKRDQPRDSNLIAAGYGGGESSIGIFRYPVAKYVGIIWTGVPRRRSLTHRNIDSASLARSRGSFLLQKSLANPAVTILQMGIRAEDRRRQRPVALQHRAILLRRLPRR